ncbi:MAG: tRNA glutamyl-Q(34) synthetase GluQRS [Gammaproteobacteria bacterium]|nr:tRNA glutamyl-Q(34) synthetase GluQRS [Gammaproteobacteria bacterium]
MPNPDNISRGRFAPSPTGPLHFGSLVAALGSYLNVKSKGGQWLLRIEDLDPPREQPGAADLIIRALDRYGFEWDGPVVYQSQRSDLYRNAIDALSRKGLTYYCTCSRKQLSILDTKQQNKLFYPGLCRGQTDPIEDSSIRLHTHDRPIRFMDQHMGIMSQILQTESGDFVIRRRDGLFAYHLAVVVDDSEQGVTEIVRGADLLEATLPQIHLQQCLGLPTPDYLHLPVAITQAGQKLSKQNLAKSISLDNPVPTLMTALEFLGQDPPSDLTFNEIMAWALNHWCASRIPKIKKIIYKESE